jgi:hypothetical protein
VIRPFFSQMSILYMKYRRTFAEHVFEFDEAHDRALSRESETLLCFKFGWLLFLLGRGTWSLFRFLRFVLFCFFVRTYRVC